MKNAIRMIHETKMVLLQYIKLIDQLVECFYWLYFR